MGSIHKVPTEVFTQVFTKVFTKAFTEVFTEPFRFFGGTNFGGSA